jgi:signal peptidase I
VVKLLSLLSIAAICASWLIFFNIAKVSSVSMMPTLKPRQSLIYLKSSYDFDINLNNILIFLNEEIAVIKRCTSLPGQEIYRIKKGGYMKKVPKDPSMEYDTITIPYQNQLLSNPKEIITYIPLIKKVEGKSIKLKDNKVYLNGKEIQEYRFDQDFFFFEGDNKTFSTDSRIYGPVPKYLIIGKQILKLW